ncbi:aldo/keto reductase [Alicyclobacillus tolerans]|uniref:aldo/keto reductase n=1 Tax=Alicyclobacillus tolerans TaxID=90970 RepID=UPI001F262DCB|nr:aldo/keto reductase [Alicyclobacillus tolerans]MCF8566834.1 aldo/keto reductase [Alicyclobacillus tolerans]
MNYRDRVSVGNTRLQVSRLGLGTAALGFMYEPISTQQAVDTIQTAFDAGIDFFDTSPLYGQGYGEMRLGKVIAKLPRERFTLASKVGYDIPEQLPEQPQEIRDRDYSYDGVMRGFENSLKRLQVGHIDILHIHDPDDHYPEAMAGAYRALSELRSQGVISAVGAGMNQSAMLTRFALEGEFDCFLLAGRYTLLDQTAMADLLPVAEEKNISLFIGGPLNSGILANPYAENAMFNYESAPQEWVVKARRIYDVCQRFEVPIKAAALQFPLAHPAVASVLTGARSQSELEENLRMMEVAIPAELWKELKRERLLPEGVPTP